MTWLYFLRKKYEVFEKFQVLKVLMANQIGKRIKALRTDDEGKLCGIVFNKFYRKQNIYQQNKTHACLNITYLLKE